MRPLPGRSTSKLGASRWFARLRSAGVSDAEDRDFRSWLSRNSRNEEEFERRELIWELMGELRHDPDMTELLRPNAARLGDANSRSSHRIRWTLALAATVAVAVVAVGYLVRSAPPGTSAVAAEDFATRTGEQRRVALADGSQVALNTATEVREHFTDKVRWLTLEHGEAIFFVKHDNKWPFVVIAGNTSTRAVGTAFDVLYVDDRAQISVLKGRVQADSSLGPRKHREVVLGAGQASTYAPATGFDAVQSAGLARITSWEQHRIEFDDTTLANAVWDFNRYIANKIVIADPGIEDIRVSGVFHIDDPRAFVGALRATFGIRSEMHGGAFVLLAPSGRFSRGRL